MSQGCGTCIVEHDAANEGDNNSGDNYERYDACRQADVSAKKNIQCSNDSIDSERSKFFDKWALQ